MRSARRVLARRDVLAPAGSSPRRSRHPATPSRRWRRPRRSARQIRRVELPVAPVPRQPGAGGDLHPAGRRQAERRLPAGHGHRLELGQADQDNESAASAGDKPMSVQERRRRAKGKIVKGSWVVGDNPRMIYVQPQRSYSIALRAGLPGIERTTLVSSSHCEVSTEAMPPNRSTSPAAAWCCRRPERRPARGHGQRARGRCAVPARRAGPRARTVRFRAGPGPQRLVLRR